MQRRDRGVVVRKDIFVTESNVGATAARRFRAIYDLPPGGGCRTTPYPYEGLVIEALMKNGVAYERILVSNSIPTHPELCHKNMVFFHKKSLISAQPEFFSANRRQMDEIFFRIFLHTLQKHLITYTRVI